MAFGHTYYYRVRAKNGAGLLSGWSSISAGVSVAPPNQPPNASFTVTPTSGDTTTTFTVDASSSTDDIDPVALLQVRWDWENDGTYDTGWTTTKTASHQYTIAGTYTIKLEVKDTGGLTSTETRQVVVQQAEVTAATITEIYPIEYEGGKDYTVGVTVRSDSDVSGDVDVILTASPNGFAVSPSIKRVHLPARQSVSVIFSASTQSHAKDGTLGFKVQTLSGSLLANYSINAKVVPLWAPSWWTDLIEVNRTPDIIAFVQNFSWNEEHLNYFKSGDVDYQWELRRPDTPNAWDFVRYDPSTGECTTEFWWTDLPGYPDEIDPWKSEEKSDFSSS